MDRVDVIIIGSGPAGLHAAIELRRHGIAALIMERDSQPGGVPRWCHHHTFPCRVKKRLFDGPGYVKAWLAEAVGIPIWTETTVLRVDSLQPAVEYTSPRGPGRIEARAILLATGARESHRHQRLVAGDRTPGVHTTASLFQSLYMYGKLPGKRFVVYGSEDVSYSCLHTILSHGGKVAAVLEPSRHQRSWKPVNWYYERMRSIPHHFNVRDLAIQGAARVEEVSFESNRIACDAIVFTGGFTPNAELVRQSDWVFNVNTRGPSINQRFQLSVPWAFAAGNCLRGVVSGDEAALEGRLSAASIASYLSREAAAGDETPLVVEPPLAYCCPDRLAAGRDGLRRIALWPKQHLANFDVAATQSDRVLWSRHFGHAHPGRRIFVPLDALAVKGAAPVRFTVQPPH
jgi:thioredoxin reductase